MQDWAHSNNVPTPGQFTPPAMDELKFKTQKIQAAIQQLNADTSIGLIVTFGGNFTWNVASQYATKPFISLVGGLLPNIHSPPSGHFMGAVSLESLDTDAARIADLVQVKPKVNNRRFGCFTILAP